MGFNIRQQYQPKIRLTGEAIAWISQYGLPIATRDFLGYLVVITKDISCIVGIDNTISPIAVNPKKITKLSKRKIRKAWKILVNTHFIKDASKDPFPEYEPYNSIPFNINKAMKIDDYLISNLDYLPDDDISDINKFGEI